MLSTGAYTPHTLRSHVTRAPQPPQQLTRALRFVQLKEASESDMELEMAIDGEDFPNN
jgi:hypothetical protein